MNNPNKPVSPILPTDTAVESGHVVPGQAEGGAEADLDGAGAGDQDSGEEVLPQTARASPEQPTASQVADHELTATCSQSWLRQHDAIHGPVCGTLFGLESHSVIAAPEPFP